MKSSLILNYELLTLSEISAKLIFFCKFALEIAIYTPHISVRLFHAAPLPGERRTSSSSLKAPPRGAKKQKYLTKNTLHNYFREQFVVPFRLWLYRYT
ncbi:MAG: hypothetical protein RR551_08335, partial [Mucinivorans sp.]